MNHLYYFRGGNFSMSPDTLSEEINIYNGVDNSIVFRRVYTKTFKVKINNLALKNIFISVLSEK